MNASLRRLAFLAAALVLLASPALHAADRSVSFSGASQFIYVSNFQNAGVSGEVTVEFWAKTNDSGQQSAFMLNPDQGTNRFQAHINYFNGNTYWDCGDAGNGGRLQVGSPANSVGNWTHYAFVSSATGGFMKIYVNGAEIASKTGASSFNTAGNGTTGYNLAIGGYTSYFLNGSLDEFRVWNVARTQWQIQTSLGATFTGAEDGLRLYYKFDEDSGIIATNSATATGTNFNGVLFNGVTRSAPARLIVANTNDSGAGSLRQAVADAAAAPGASYITFDSLLSGQTIKLDSHITVGDATGPVTIDARSLPGGLTLDGSGGAASHSVFFVEANSTLSLHGLTLTGAKAGAIVSFGSLTLTRCTLFGNSFSTGDGGGIFSDKPLALTHCTLAGNTAERGGAIFVYKTGSIFTHCTLSGNTATISGGAISCPNKSVVLENCIVAGNIDGDAGTATDNIECGGVIGDPNLFSDDPLLSPLGYYGGSTMTMRPLPGSPAIDGGSVIAGLSTDQRGFARNVDGNASGGAQPDLGAVELNHPVTVTTLKDELDTPSSEGTGISLREAVRDGADVFFDPALSGKTIGLTSGTEIVLDKDVIIDASSLPAGLTVDGIATSGYNRLFTVSVGQSVVMTGLTLTGGTGTGASNSGNGGAILNLGTLSMTRCLIYGNQASDQGGAVQNQGVLNLKACSLVQNSALISGGGLHNALLANLSQCTVAGNTCNGGGGGIRNTGSFFVGLGVILTLEHCTIAQNSANEAGGIYNDTSATIKIAQTVVAGNAAASTPEFLNNALVVPSGLSLVLGPFNSSLPGSGTVTNTLFIGYNPNISLGQLGYYGGGMPTMPPKPGSPIIDASFGSTITTDQRGFPVTGTKPDIGAAERQGTETLTVTTTADELDTLLNTQTSLREAITDGAAAKIVFAAALNGGTITLESSRGEIAITRGVSVDATSLPEGLTLHGGTGTNRIFNINVTDPDQVSLKCLTLTGGEAPGGSGGAILAGGTGSLRIQRCTFTGNTAAEGGGIFSTASLALESCTFSGNTGNYGGALQCLGSTAIANCTISGNQGSTVCGGIFNKFTTVAKPLLIINSIISGNTSPWPDGDDIYSQSGVIWFLEANIVGSRYQDINSTVVSGSTTPLTSDPLLGPLRDYGGPTQTMALKPGSPARNAGTGAAPTSDQRGFPIDGVADLGAYEAGAGVAGAAVNFNIWALEIYGQALLPEGDNDKDGITNLAEYAAKTEPFKFNEPPVSSPSANTGGGSSFAAAFSQAGGESGAAAAPPPSVLSYDLSFRYNPEATDLRYIFQRSSDLSPTGWTDIYTYDSTTGLITETSGVIGDEYPGGNVIYITDSAFNPARTFWRLVVEQP